MVKLILICVLSLSSISYASILKPDSHCDENLLHTYYEICYSQNHRQALWTFHKLTKNSINGDSKRKNNYRSDPKVVDPVSKNDYKGSGFDRGHLVPAGDMKLNKIAMSETFFMTNMSPQRPDLNRKIWNSLESGIRKMVKKFGDAWIVTAPILSNNLPQLSSHISIPKYYYKIAYFPLKKVMRAYLFENKSHPGKKFSDFQVSVDSIEMITGIDYFAALDDQLEARLEKAIH